MGWRGRKGEDGICSKSAQSSCEKGKEPYPSKQLLRSGEVSLREEEKKWVGLRKEKWGELSQSAVRASSFLCSDQLASQRHKRSKQVDENLDGLLLQYSFRSNEERRPAAEGDRKGVDEVESRQSGANRKMCLLFYILATPKVLSGQVLTCDSGQSWRLYSTSKLGDQAASSMTWYLTQSNYTDTEPTSHCPTLIIPSAWLGSNTCQF